MYGARAAAGPQAVAFTIVVHVPVLMLFSAEQWLACPLEQALGFFADPRKLQRISPPGSGASLLNVLIKDDIGPAARREQRGFGRPGLGTDHLVPHSPASAAAGYTILRNVLVRPSSEPKIFVTIGGPRNQRLSVAQALAMRYS
jgi:hypothetical protein